MASEASTRFDQLMDYVAQLIELNARVRMGRGRRHRQDALHRAGVVMTVAAWESYIESAVIEAIDSVRPVGGPPWSLIAHQLAVGQARYQAGRLHTPNAENVRELLRSTIGFDPWTVWSWASPRRNWDQAEMVTRLNGWLRIRHTVAHGGDLPANINWIMDNRRRPRLHLPLLRDCRNFFRHIVRQTDEGLATAIHNDYGIVPW